MIQSSFWIDPNPASIRRRMIHAKEMYSIAAANVEAIQLECTHINVKKVSKSSTGNWDRGDDSYWYECKCLDCDKFWCEDQ